MLKLRMLKMKDFINSDIFSCSYKLAFQVPNMNRHWLSSRGRWTRLSIECQSARGGVFKPYSWLNCETKSTRRNQKIIFANTAFRIAYSCLNVTIVLICMPTELFHKKNIHFVKPIGFKESRSIKMWPEINLFIELWGISIQYDIQTYGRNTCSSIKNIYLNERKVPFFDLYLYWEHIHKVWDVCTVKFCNQKERNRSSQHVNYFLKK